MYLSWILIIVISALSILICTLHDKKKNAAYFNVIERTNKSAVAYLEGKGFNITKSVDILDFVTKNAPSSSVKKIFLDENSHEIALIDYSSNKVYISKIDEIYNVEIVDHSDVSNGYVDVFHTKTNTCYYLYLSICFKGNCYEQINYEVINRDMYILGIGKSNDVYAKLYNSTLSAKNIIESHMSNDNQK